MASRIGAFVLQEPMAAAYRNGLVLWVGSIVGSKAALQTFKRVLSVVDNRRSRVLMKPITVSELSNGVDIPGMMAISAWKDRSAVEQTTAATTRRPTASCVYIYTGQVSGPRSSLALVRTTVVEDVMYTSGKHVRKVGKWISAYRHR